MPASTMPEYLRPLMRGTTYRLDRCPVCGRRYPLEQHHPVRRSDGELFDENGRKLRKPTVTLCGFGNNLYDSDGRPYCHGLAHHGLLFLDWIEGWYGGGKRSKEYGGHWEALLLTERERDAWKRRHPGLKLDLVEARKIKGWRRLPWTE